MKTIKFAVLCLLLCALLWPQKSFAQGTTAFNYQGRLNGGGTVLNGSFDLSFSLYTLSAGGAPLGQVTNSAVPVTDGFFSTQVDFSANVDGKSFWLEVGVRSNASGSFVILTPRQQLLTVPYAMFAHAASNITGTVSTAQFTGVLGSGQFAGTYSNSLWLSNTNNILVGDGGGLFNLNATALAYGSVPSGRISGTYGSPVSFSNTGNFFTGTGSGLVALNASQLTTGVVPDARLAGTYSSVLALTNPGNTLAGSGAGITDLNASQLNAGNVPDKILSANVPILSSGSLSLSSGGGFGAPQLKLTQTASDFCRLRLIDPANSWDIGAGPDGTLRFYSGADNLILNGNGDATLRNNLNFGSTTRQMLNLWSTNHGIGVQAGTTYFRSADTFDWYAGGAHVDAGGNAGGGRIQMQLSGLGRLAVGQSIASGDYSFASGQSQATGQTSAAVGSSGATAFLSFAAGISLANGQRSAAVCQSVADGYSSFTACQGHATGTNSAALSYSVASGQQSVSLAGRATAAGDDSLASGSASTAYGNYSTAIGSSCVASNTAAISMGSQNVASGYGSTALGVSTRVTSFAEVAVGEYNFYQAPYSTTAYDSRDIAFSVGVGFNEGFRNNAITVLKGGNVGIGAAMTTPTHLLQLPNDSLPQNTPLAYAWSTYSDARLKESITNISYGLDTVMKLQPRGYVQHAATIAKGELRNTGDSKPEIGFVAQELYTVVPEAVSKPKDEANEFWSVDYAKLVPVLAKAVQELKTENDGLKRRIEALESAKK